MAYRIMRTREAVAHSNWLSARERRIMETAINLRLRHQPATETNAIKRLRPNPVAEFELRVGDLRALYNVFPEDELVGVSVIGRKVGNLLYVEGEEYHEHESHPPESV